MDVPLNFQVERLVRNLGESKKEPDPAQSRLEQVRKVKRYIEGAKPPTDAP